MNNPKFAHIQSLIPSQESLKNVIERAAPFWDSCIVPEIHEGKKILIVAHGTSLRGLVKHIESLSEQEVQQLNLPNGIPFIYEFDPETMKLLTKQRRYLADDETLQKEIAKVASIGSKN